MLIRLLVGAVCAQSLLAEGGTRLPASEGAGDALRALVGPVLAELLLITGPLESF